MTPAGPSLWTLLEPLTWVLLHFVWQGLLVAAALAVLLWLTQRATPWTRYRIACWSLLVMVCLPLVTLTVLLGNHGPTTEIQSTLVGTEASAGASLDVVPNAVASLIERPSTWLGTRQSLEVLRWSLFAVWLIGVAAQSASHTFGWTQLRRLARIGCRPAPSNWQRLVDQLAHRLGLGVAVKVLQSTAIEVPTVIGWLRPVVLLPVSSLTGLDAQQLEAVLAHELAHIWRRDYLVNLLQVCAETILFYHPAVWWVSRQIREEREHCCDDAAVALTGDRMALAKALLKLEELRGTTPHLAPAASGGSLVQRISRLLGGKAVSHHQTRHPLLNAVFIVSILAVVGVAWAAVATHPPNAGLLAASNTELLAPNVAGGAGIHDSDTIHGTWEADHKFGRDRIRLNVIGEHGKSNMNIRIGSADFSALAGGSTELRREAGTIRFEGNPGVGSGSGRFTFQPNWQFLEQLKRYDIDGYGSHEMFVLATMDIDLDYVSEIDRLGYGEELDGDTLIAIGIHGVSPDYIRGITSRGYENTELDEFLAMRIHGVTVDEIDEIRALGYELDADEMLAWRIHGVDR
ncbi:MAG: M56 family metallopeptidase, partial [bacterium]|nr:M56 family metallopeptidase [bacterium]